MGFPTHTFGLVVGWQYKSLSYCQLRVTATPEGLETE